ncbi:ribonuclease H2 non-catalytic subunit-domain-containing protein [Dichotomopilus funicola]|uniref:Ribonuclease H2 non-catalytic subunit-domain-containing protein n=1 Tax=Dichotomopilus funicola TaxID=1934379 RepID=A0AAN6ZJK8_9PEZI|nr:ribonuclease H2 non-catalytic subunit-domain-containing protein [Dichotomopilus funicola]
MSQLMLTLKSAPLSGETPKATPHLLPCRIHHDGPAEPARAFWDPKPSEDGSSQTAYFRGRKLHGTTVNLPPDYRGIVAVTSAAAAPKDGEPEVIDLEAPDSDNIGLPQGTLQTQAEFDEMVVWGHETAVDAAGDAYLRGVGEWLELAGKIHAYPTPLTKEK